MGSIDYKPEPCIGCSERERCKAVGSACDDFDLFVRKNEVLKIINPNPNADLYDQHFPNETDLKMRRAL